MPKWEKLSLSTKHFWSFPVKVLQCSCKQLNYSRLVLKYKKTKIVGLQTAFPCNTNLQKPWRHKLSWKDFIYAPLKLKSSLHQWAQSVGMQPTVNILASRSVNDVSWNKNVWLLSSKEYFVDKETLPTFHWHGWLYTFSFKADQKCLLIVCMCLNRTLF